MDHEADACRNNVEPAVETFHSRGRFLLGNNKSGLHAFRVHESHNWALSIVFSIPSIMWALKVLAFFLLDSALNLWAGRGE